MAKAKENAIATTEERLPTKFDYGEDVGAGFEGQTQEDKSLPWLTLLQQLSPQVKKGDQRIDGAEPGMFCNCLSKKIYPEGVDVVLASTEHVFVEWKPDMGGFVGRRALNDPEVVEARQTQDFGKYKTKAGNDLIETFYYYGVTADSCTPFIMAITGTKIKAYKQFNSRLDMFRTADLQQKPPLYAHLIRFTSFEDRRGNNDFYNIAIRGAVNDDLDAGLLEPSDKRFLAAKALCRVVKAGEAKVDYDAQRPEEKAEDDVF